MRLQTQERGSPAAEEYGRTISFDALGDGAHDSERGVCSACVLDPALDDVDGGDERGAQLFVE